MRKLVAVALTSSIFGGALGALATAATQSAANPSAIAAAVQRVQDQQADTTLSQIRGKLQAANGKLGGLGTALSTSGYGLGAELLTEVKTVDTDLQAMSGQLREICRNTSSQAVPEC